MTVAIAVQQIARSTAEGRFEIGGIAFADPWFLLAIPICVALLWRGREARRHAAARVPTIGASDLPSAGGLAVRLGWTPAVARILASVLVITALSRPLEGRVSVGQETEGIDIAVILDRSSSMDQRPRPGAPRRFDVVVDVITDFAKRRMTDEEGNVQIVTFDLRGHEIEYADGDEMVSGYSASHLSLAGPDMEDLEDQGITVTGVLTTWVESENAAGSPLFEKLNPPVQSVMGNRVMSRA